ncbi:hypothetical protein SULPSESMR1_04930 (plasmid) [Pseudosulfitobacter pseudonitzschiae]|uniref:Capsule polysaccharide biosynthesis protein n=1 Tax=Pseudosulfitobacter pseudonitzschiae TaxID=1402135 RepID=A0A221K6M3_9RHOB|nr:MULTISPECIES: hypothetical protein [Roseobacteraceae]ASM74625.1 hypothetical protein SULPSESMR1_04930 [Pseudosulfitobacter pseudonitzschiae]
MTRITFIENRGKTAFWIRVAKALAANGHEIGWIVQNPAYAPPKKSGGQAVLPFPRGSDLRPLEGPVPEALSGDRGRAFFRTGTDHYAHYTAEIARAFDMLRPEVVIGEPTLFHEMIAIAEARKRMVPYLHPTMTRYPGGRFAVLDGDTQNPVIGSGDKWENADLTAVADAIATGRSLPSYMAKPVGVQARRRQMQRFVAHARTLKGRLAGEHYNTPALTTKLALEKTLQSQLVRWRRMQRLPDRGQGPIILYPLQMQPEANIDVWGRPWSDQTVFVTRLLATLPPGGQVAVKANPKSKYEVSESLMDLAAEQNRVVLMPLDQKMDAAQAATTGCVTVSGTVGLEAVFGRGRTLSLRHPVLEHHFPSFHAPTPEDAVERLLIDPSAGRGDVGTGIALLTQLIADSFAGTVSEPLYDPDCLRSDNITRVVHGIETAIAATASRQSP